MDDLERHERGRSALRLDVIDTLRGGSILAVILLHINIRMRLAGFPFQSHFPPWLFHLVFTNGNNGVSVFFAISGFLITTTSLRRFGSLENVNVRTFYRTRFARIAPLLLLVLFILSLLHVAQAPGFYIQPAESTLPRALFAALTFHLNWLEAVRGYLPPNWDVLWSLSVEEAFYLFFPLVCLLTRKRNGNIMLLGFLLLLVAAGPFARTIWTSNDIWREKSYLGGADGIAMGCLSALAADWLRTTRYERGSIGRDSWLMPMQMAGAVVLIFIALWPRWAITRYIGIYGLDGSLLALGTCAIAIPSALKNARGHRWTGPVRWLGRNSYEVYMTHEFVVVWTVGAYVRFHAGTLSIWIVLVLLISGGLGAAVTFSYSEPLNRRLRGQQRTRTSIAISPKLGEAL